MLLLYIDDRLPAEAIPGFLVAIQDPANAAALREAIAAQMEAEPQDEEAPEQLDHLFTGTMWKAARMQQQQGRMTVLKRIAWSAAAAVLIFAGIRFAWLSMKAPVIRETVQVAQDTIVRPGSNKALLTLADGSVLALGDAAGDTLAMQQSSLIIGAYGELTYNQGNADTEAPVQNTLTTPPGGQYRLILPDGSKVWLNATSSITYPVAFTGELRKVAVTGEAYFEVKQHAEMPFVVDAGGQEISVLGTAFNVNVYKNEPFISTALVQGRVRVKSKTNSLLLQPGRQAVCRNPAIAGIDAELPLTSTAYTGGEPAWKNGLFNFRDADLPAMMRQLERWYDITVQYEGTPPVLNFRGELTRDLSIDEILDVLNKVEVYGKLEGRILMISNKKKK